MDCRECIVCLCPMSEGRCAVQCTPPLVTSEDVIAHLRAALGSLDRAGQVPARTLARTAITDAIAYLDRK